MDIMRWIERVLGRHPAAPAYDAEQYTDLLPLATYSGVHIVVEFPRDSRVIAVAYAREIAAFQAGIHAAGSGERRN